MELSISDKIPKWLRIFFAVIIITFMLATTIGIIIIGLLLLKKEPIASIFFIILGVVLSIGAISKIKTLYFSKRNPK